jgi:hypothetical protein
VRRFINPFYRDIVEEQAIIPAGKVQSLDLGMPFRTNWQKNWSNKQP